MVNDAVQIPLALIWSVWGRRSIHYGESLGIAPRADPNRKSRRWKFSRWRRTFTGNRDVYRYPIYFARLMSSESLPRSHRSRLDLLKIIIKMHILQLENPPISEREIYMEKRPFRFSRARNVEIAAYVNGYSRISRK